MKRSDFMKKRLLPVLLSFVLLSSCAPAYIEESSAVVAENSDEASEYDELEAAEFPDRYQRYVLDVYKGKTEAELEAEFDYSQTRNCYYELSQSATNVYFESGDILYRYSKQSGIVTPLCPDPLCDHSSCIYSQCEQFPSSGRNVYLEHSIHNDDWSSWISQVYKCNADGTEPKLLGSFENRSIGELLCVGDDLYARFQRFDDENNSTFYSIVKFGSDGKLKQITDPELSCWPFTDGVNLLMKCGDDVYRIVDDTPVLIRKGVATGVLLLNGYIYFAYLEENEGKNEYDYVYKRVSIYGGEDEDVSSPLLYDSVVSGDYVYYGVSIDGVTSITKRDPETLEVIKSFEFTDGGKALAYMGVHKPIVDKGYIFTLYYDDYDVRKAAALAEKKGGRYSPRYHLAILDIETNKKYVILHEEDTRS